MLRLPVVQSPSGVPRPATRRRKFSGERYLNFRCTHCGNCCVDTIVPVTAEDVLRLRAGTRLPVEQIVAFYKRDDFDDGGDGLGFAVLDVGERVMGLRRRFNDERDDDACRFFQGNRCTAYDHRPATCRLWPFLPSLDEAGQLTRLRLNDAVPCRYELDGEGTSPARIAADWQLDEAQDQRWHAQVERWNARHRGGTRRAFLAWVGLRE